MSIAVMKAVWDHSAADGTALLVLLAIADNANDAGEAWPSIPTIAAKARVSERQAMRLIQQLAEMGELRIMKGLGRGHSNHYVVTVARKGDKDVTINKERVTPMSPFTPVEKGDANVTISQEKVTSRARKGDIQGRKGDIAMSPEPSIEPLYKPSYDSVLAHGGQKNSSSDLNIPSSLREFDAVLREMPGYKPSLRFYKTVQERYSDLDLVQEAVKACEWLSNHQKRKCTTLFVLRWLSNAAEARAIRAATNIPVSRANPRHDPSFQRIDRRRPIPISEVT